VVVAQEPVGLASLLRAGLQNAQGLLVRGVPHHRSRRAIALRAEGLLAKLKSGKQNLNRTATTTRPHR
jgi:hypothetical protein